MNLLKQAALLLGFVALCSVQLPAFAQMFNGMVPVPTQQEMQAPDPDTSNGKPSGSKLYPDAPEYDRTEFQYFAVPEDGADDAKAVLTPLMMAPKFAIKFKDKSVTTLDMKKIFAETYALQIINIFPQSELNSHADLLVAMNPGASQNDILGKLNLLSQEANGLWDVAPIFIVNNRQVMVDAIVVQFAVPTGRKVLEQMLKSYGEISDLGLNNIDHAGRWVVRPLNSMFLLGAKDVTVAKSNEVHRKFQMHMLLLANLLEKQKLLKGVTVLQARPTFFYIDDPVIVNMMMQWPSDSIGGDRELRLSIVVADTEHVLFKKSDIPDFGAGDFKPRINGVKGLPVKEGWIPMVGPDGWEGDMKPVEHKIGNIKYYEYTFLKHFRLLQPSDMKWSIDSIAIPFLYRETKKMGWDQAKPMNAKSNSLEFGVLTHTSYEVDIAMPPAAEYQFSKAVTDYLQPLPDVVPAENTHQFGRVLRGADHIGMRGVLLKFPLIGALVGSLFLIIAAIMYLRNRAALDARKPKAYAFMSQDELESRLHAITTGDIDAPDALRKAIRGVEVLVDNLLISRIPDLLHVNTPELKAAQESLGKDRPEIAEVIAVALVLRSYTDILSDRTKEQTHEALLRNFEAMTKGLPDLYAKLAKLPPRMTRGVVFKEKEFGPPTATSAAH